MSKMMKRKAEKAVEQFVMAFACDDAPALEAWLKRVAVLNGPGRAVVPIHVLELRLAAEHAAGIPSGTSYTEIQAMRRAA